MSLMPELSPTIKKQYLKILKLATVISFVIYFGLFAASYFSSNSLFFEISHLPLHLFAIFFTTFIILGIYEKLERDIHKFAQNKPRILRYLPTAKISFKAIGISLKDIHEDPKTYEKILNYLTTSTCPNLDIKFLFLDPSSSQSNSQLLQRELEEDGKRTNRLVDECNKTRDTLKTIKENLQNSGNRHSFNYHMYNLPPRHSVIIVDDTLVNVVPYLYKRRGSKTEGFESIDPMTVQQYVEEFNLIWGEIEKEKV